MERVAELLGRNVIKWKGVNDDSRVCASLGHFCLRGL